MNFFSSVQCTPVVCWPYPLMNRPKANSPKNRPTKTAKKYPTFKVMTAIILHIGSSIKRDNTINSRLQQWSWKARLWEIPQKFARYERLEHRWWLDFRHFCWRLPLLLKTCGPSIFPIQFFPHSRLEQWHPERRGKSMSRHNLLAKKVSTASKKGNRLIL